MPVNLKNQKKFWEAVNNCEHPWVVLVLCVFGTCRAVNVLAAPVFASLRALELLSPQCLPLILM